MYDELQPLRRPSWKIPPLLDSLKLAFRRSFLHKFWAEYIRRRNRILNRKVDSYTSDRRHGMRCIADAQKPRAGPEREPVDYDGQKTDFIPIAQLCYAISQERCQTGDFLAERFQPSLSDFVGCAFRNHERTLPVIVAIEQNQNFALVDMAKGLPRIIGTRRGDGARFDAASPCWYRGR